jgi:protein involved in polysaccharide export with SLBB domain
LQPNAGLYQYQPGDVIYVVVLNAPQRGQEAQQISENDITVYNISIDDVER